MFQFQAKIREEIFKVINSKNVNLSTDEFKSINQNLIDYVNQQVQNFQSLQSNQNHFKTDIHQILNRNLSQHINSIDLTTKVSFFLKASPSERFLSNLQHQMLKILIIKSIEVGCRLNQLIKTINLQEFEGLQNNKIQNQPVYEKIQNNENKMYDEQSQNQHPINGRNSQGKQCLNKQKGLYSTSFSGKKVYNKLSQLQSMQLYKDMLSKSMSRQELMQKYQISISTFHRIMKRFSQRDFITQRTINLEQQKSIQNSHPIQNKSPEFYIEQRYQFMKQYSKLNEQKLIFVDEVRFWKKVSQKEGEKVRFNQKGPFIQVHMILALSKQKIVHWKLKNQCISPTQYAQFINEIHEKLYDHIFIVDNHKNHKRKDILGMFENKHVKILYLPPNSPELNPISIFFNSFKIRLLPRIKDQYQNKQILEETHKLCIQMRQDGKILSFFKRNARFRALAQTKKPFIYN